MPGNWCDCFQYNCTLKVRISSLNVKRPIDLRYGGIQMGKVIDLTSRLKTVAHNQPKFLSEPQKSVEQTEVLNYAEQKQKILFHERRQVKRTILTEFVSAMVVLPEKGLLKVAIYDISEEGISFDLDFEQGRFKLDEEVSLRVYLNQKTYFPLTMQIKHVTEELEEGVVRHGAVFLRHVDVGATTSDAALQHFIRFIETVSSGLKKDEGDLMAPKIS